MEKEGENTESIENAVSEKYGSRDFMGFISSLLAHVRTYRFVPNFGKIYTTKK